MSDPSGEHRADPRIGCVLELRYRSAGHLLVSYCTNLSRGGLFLPTPDPLPIGSSVTLNIQLPEDTTTRALDSTVRWVRAEPSPDGPAGMGLAFKDVDAVLGDRIDQIVGELEPLTIEIVGGASRTWQHVASLARSMVTCETRQHDLGSVIAPDLAGADLVIVDLNSDPDAAMDLLHALHALEPTPPTLGLCHKDKAKVRTTAEAVTQVIGLPIDSNDLQAHLLRRLARVDSRPA